MRNLIELKRVLKCNNTLQLVQDFLIPERSVLYSVEPFGIGTPQCESLRSYFLGIAGLHCLTPDRLFKEVVAPFCSDHDCASENFKKSWLAPSFCSTGIVAEKWSTALEKLTCQKELHFLTLLPYKSVLPTLGLTTTTRKWCPICLEEGLQVFQGERTYEQLIWEIDVVKCCPVHKIQLTSTCPGCERLGSLKFAGKQPGFCQKCGLWLGLASFANLKNATEDDLWDAQQIAKIICYIPKIIQPLSRNGVLKVVNRLIDVFFDGSGQKFSQYLGVAKSIAFKYKSNLGLPSLRMMLHIVKNFNISLIDLVTGDADVAEEKGRLLTNPTQYIRKHRLHPIIRDWADVGDRLIPFLSCNPPLSGATICQRLDIGSSMLYKKFPKEAKIITNRYKTHIAKKAIERFETECYTMRKIARKQFRSGVVPTLKSVSKERGIAYGLDKKLREACRKICLDVSLTQLV